MTFLLCDPGWCVHKRDVQDKWDDNTDTLNSMLGCTRARTVVLYDGHTYSKSMDQSGKATNPARGQLNREN